MLTNNQEFYKICFDNSREGIIVIDEFGKILLANSRVEKIFGYKPEELINESVSILLPKSIKQKHEQFLAGYYDKPFNRNDFDKRDLYGIHKNGQKVEVLIGLNYFQLDEKNYVKAFISDISDYKKKEQVIRNKNYQLEQELKIKNKELKAKNKQLREANIVLLEEINNKIAAEKKAKIALEKEIELNNLKTKFISLASHEFRTPLSGILTSVTLIDKHQKNNTIEKIEKHVNQIKTMVNHLNNILYDFLALEQLSNSNITYRYKTFNPFELINKIIEETKSILKKNQQINYSSHNSNKEIINDYTIISIIITNLLYNAIKYSHEDSIIEIDSKIKEDKLIVSIKDYGIGIPKEDQKHIFERFFRAKNAMEIQGTGIGLNIIKGHIDGLGGSISFKSKENVGTEFSFEVPNFSIK
ncbi:MAG: PAS domain-containing sensor histidine kinase [Flavobacteriaceae bacterium]|nr:PAS domain-containing sensor histidine kinase [Flavobacteriaceae bacterium]